MNVNLQDNSNELLEINLNSFMAALFGILLVVDVLLVGAHGKVLHQTNFYNESNFYEERISQVTLLKVSSPIKVDVDLNGDITWDHVVLPDSTALKAKLREMSIKNDMLEVHLRINKLTEYKVVAHILASARELGVAGVCLNYEDQILCPASVKGAPYYVH